ncbi:uncharacterized protein [Rutidosis leptorrhynchoides]|uniref:uncharacterized protein n=1 Tax=Rutidosis leptorrhynchoides TaxID=125765 RepID=UPI003A9997E8
MSYKFADLHSKISYRLLIEKMGTGSKTMSIDNSVVDSSVTEWKHEVDRNNKQEFTLRLGFSVMYMYQLLIICGGTPESPNEKVDKDGYRFGVDDEDHSCEQVETSNANNKRNKPNGTTRYFIIKSLNHENIQLSIQRGIWATQVMNEPILEDAYHNSGKVILIFSVNMSGSFQGYAQMMSSVGWRRDNVWSHGHGGGKPWGRSFKVKWLRLHDLSFPKTLHLKNPLNDFKPVKISRDCQELPQDIGEALCELIDTESRLDENHNSYDFCGLRDAESHVDPMHISMAGPPLMYPTNFYHHKSDASRFHVAQHRQTGSFRNTSENSFTNRNVANVDTGGDGSLSFDGWDMSAERTQHDNALTDDDILEMCYGYDLSIDYLSA